jgi:hypothetical protein
MLDVDVNLLMGYVLVVYLTLNLNEMLSNITYCDNCTDIEETIASIDCKLFEISKRLYNNIILSLNKSIDMQTMLTLLRYRRILVAKSVNAEYACGFSIFCIISRVKFLIHR